MSFLYSKPSDPAVAPAVCCMTASVLPSAHQVPVAWSLVLSNLAPLLYFICAAFLSHCSCPLGCLVFCSRFCYKETPSPNDFRQVGAYSDNKSKTRMGSPLRSLPHVMTPDPSGQVSSGWAAADQPT